MYISAHKLRAYHRPIWRPVTRFSKVPKTCPVRKAIRKTLTRSFCKAGLFICCKGNKTGTQYYYYLLLLLLLLLYYYYYYVSGLSRNGLRKGTTFRGESAPFWLWRSSGCFRKEMNHLSPANCIFQSLSFPQACAERLGIWQEGCLTDVLCACAVWWTPPLKESKMVLV